MLSDRDNTNGRMPYIDVMSDLHSFSLFQSWVKNQKEKINILLIGDSECIHSFTYQCKNYIKDIESKFTISVLENHPEENIKVIIGTIPLTSADYVHALLNDYEANLLGGLCKHKLLTQSQIQDRIKKYQVIIYFNPEQKQKKKWEDARDLTRCLSVDFDCANIDSSIVEKCLNKIEKLVTLIQKSIPWWDVDKAVLFSAGNKDSESSLSGIPAELIKHISCTFFSLENQHHSTIQTIEQARSKGVTKQHIFMLQPEDKTYQVGNLCLGIHAITPKAPKFKKQYSLVLLFKKEGKELRARIKYTEDSVKQLLDAMQNNTVAVIELLKTWADECATMIAAHIQDELYQHQKPVYQYRTAFSK